jgi:2-iminoacetate synthase
MKFGSGEIRRINVNIGATSHKDYARLKDASIGTYILFQETYHRETYNVMHPCGPKSNYEHQLNAFDRAMNVGLVDVGGGVLFGLYDHRYEVLALMLHNEHLERRFGSGFHTVSMPRIRQASGVSTEYPFALDDESFKRVAAVMRLAIPYTGIILSTREAPQMRKALINAGVSQISAGSRTAVGGYGAVSSGAPQFSTVDYRTTEDVAMWLMDEGYVPSFCTACYRMGRTGDRFMELAKSGAIRNVCLPNGLLTLKEYALDYGSHPFAAKADALIAAMLPDITDGDVRAVAVQNLQRLEQGQRDIFF